MVDPDRVKSLGRPHGLPFRIGKLGHIVLNVRDVERSARFYTEMLGFQISDVYPEEMVPGGMVFLRCNPDHHGIALVGSLKEPAGNADLNHIAFEVATLDEVVRAHDHLRRHGLEIYWGIDQIGSDGHVRPSSEWKGARSLEDAIADPVRGQDTTLHDPSLLGR